MVLTDDWKQQLAKLSYSSSRRADTWFSSLPYKECTGVATSLPNFLGWIRWIVGVTGASRARAPLIYFFENDQEHIKMSFFGRGMTLFFYPLLKRQWKKRLFCQIFITVLTSWKARIFFTTQQTSCISWSLINTITPVIPWCIPDFVPSFHFALRYCCFVAITLYSPYPQWANHTPKRCVAKNPFSSRIP